MEGSGTAIKETKGMKKVAEEEEGEGDKRKKDGKW